MGPTIVRGAVVEEEENMDNEGENPAITNAFCIFQIPSTTTNAPENRKNAVPIFPLSELEAYPSAKRAGAVPSANANKRLELVQKLPVVRAYS